MNMSSRIIIIPILEVVFLLMATNHSFDVAATQSTTGVPLSPAFNPQPCSLLSTGSCSPILFDDEFDGNELDQNKWDIFGGSPVVNVGWLTLSGADILIKSVFGSGILQGVIQSTDWKSQSQFSDSSFGFEIWTGNNGQCHYGIVFKTNGHLAMLRPQPDINGNCSGDPLYQDYQTVSNWETIRAGGTLSFTLNWCNEVATLSASGNGQEGQASYTGQAIPIVPLKIRLYAQPTETYEFDYIQLCACNAVYLPIIMHP
jgi:hypothetical protein